MSELYEVAPVSAAARRILDKVDDAQTDALDLARALEDGEALAAWGFNDDDIQAIDEAYSFLENWDAMVNLMDPELLDEAWRLCEDDSRAECLDHYLELHSEKYGEPFRFN